MFDKVQIERILKQHGMSPDSPEDEIRSLLLKIDWHKDDIDSALYVLRSNEQNNIAYVDSLHKVVRSDERLRPETIKSLLGIDIGITSKDIEAVKKQKQIRRYSLNQIFSILLTSIMIGLILVIFGMWYMDFGLFHPTHI